MKKHILSCIHNEIPALLDSLRDSGGELYSEVYKYEFGGIAENIQDYVENEYHVNILELAIVIKFLFVQCLHDCVPMEHDVYLRIAKSISSTPVEM